MNNPTLPLDPSADEARPPLDPALREALIAKHMGLVHHAAARWARRPGGLLDRDDLVAYGTIGLIQAIDRFDHTRGANLASYALHRIRGAMLDAARTLDPLPRSTRRTVSQLEGARSALTPALGREPSADEVCAAAGLTDSQYQDAMTVVSRLAISIESMAAQDDGNRDHPGFLQPTDPADEDFTGNVESRELIGDLTEAVSRLPEREMLIVSLYFKEGLNLDEIAAVLNISASRISQLKARALGRLRFSLRWHEVA